MDQSCSGINLELIKPLTLGPLSINQVNQILTIRSPDSYSSCRVTSSKMTIGFPVKSLANSYKILFQNDHSYLTAAVLTRVTSSKMTIGILVKSLDNSYKILF